MEKTIEMDGAIDKVFALENGSIDDEMVGDRLEPINSYSPTIKNQIVGSTLGILHSICGKTKEVDNKEK